MVLCAYKFISLCLIAAPLTGAQLYATAAAAGAVHSFNTITDIQAVIAGFTEDFSETMNTNKTRRAAALENAAIDYAKALLKGEYVPDDAMKVMRTASDDIKGSNGASERQQIISIIINSVRDQDEKTVIAVPNTIPPFLLPFVENKTALVHSMIDAMSLNKYVEEHMKHSVGQYYENKQNTWPDSTHTFLEYKFNAMAKEYRLLDDAVKDGADLTDVNYIVIPDVGATDAAITRRTADLMHYLKHIHT